MMSPKKKLLLSTLLLSFLLEIIAVIVTMTMSNAIITPALPYLVPFFMAVSLLSNLWLISISTGNPNKFVRTYLIVTFLKFFVYLAVLLTYVMLSSDDAVNFIFCYLVLFIIYLVFDVIILGQTLPKNNKPRI